VTVPLACVFVAFVLIWVPRIAAFVAQARQPGGYDNRAPRDQQARLEGWGKRAQAAHANAFEAFAPFAAAVLVAHVAHADAAWSANLAVLFVVARTLYPLAYLADKATVRSVIWLTGLGATTGLFLLPWLTLTRA
jgi:uncharacterized MAPEG superfamily protein